MWFRKGTDGLTDRQRRKYARRYWKVVNTPLGDDVRQRAQQAGTRLVRLERLPQGEQEEDRA